MVPLLLWNHYVPSQILSPNRTSDIYIKVPIQNSAQLDNEILKCPSTKGAKKAKLALKIQ